MALSGTAGAGSLIAPGKGPSPQFRVAPHTRAVLAAGKGQPRGADLVRIGGGENSAADCGPRPTCAGRPAWSIEDAGDDHQFSWNGDIDDTTKPGGIAG